MRVGRRDRESICASGQRLRTDGRTYVVTYLSENLAAPGVFCTRVCQLHVACPQAQCVGPSGGRAGRDRLE